ncbi:MAG: D-alanyl-D-alanine carboxypeptidase/D-alanyl-D-alanine-endopeptidase [Chitinophagaceae bacterium]
MKLVFSFFICFFSLIINAQSIPQNLQKAWQLFESDSQLKHAISSLYVIDAKTGHVVFDKNSQIGLAPASTQKIITSATAFELLGKDYRYETKIGFNGTIKNDTLFGDLMIKGVSDPTLGSWRYKSTSRHKCLEEIAKILNNKNIKIVTGDIFIDESGFDTQTTPDGWIWQDMGNYYGAGSAALSWNENQYDLILESGTKIGDPVKIVRTEPELDIYAMLNEIKSGPKGSGDNAYIYLAPNTVNGSLKGTIPVDETNFKISGSFGYPSGQFYKELNATLKLADINLIGKLNTTLYLIANGSSPNIDFKPLDSLSSPSLDSISYWFLKKSINLYGEALIKTFAYEKDGFGSTDEGVKIVKDFWKQKGIDEDELNISDGSGLSPQNRVTTHAQVEILKYAKTKDWFPYFYDGIPDYNGMKMKSGTIRDVKGFCGYHKAKDGKEYIFSFLVNNYNGRSSGVVSKMYKILDVLK